MLNVIISPLKFCARGFKKNAGISCYNVYRSYKGHVNGLGRIILNCPGIVINRACELTLMRLTVCRNSHRYNEQGEKL